MNALSLLRGCAAFAFLPMTVSLAASWSVVETAKDTPHRLAPIAAPVAAK
jgi:hypothetical protein